MYRACALFLSIAALLGCGSSAWAIRLPGRDDLSLQYPGAPKPPQEDSQVPYAMTYTDELARSLGVKDGHMAFSTAIGSSVYLPSFSVGVGGDGAMLRLKWRPD